MSRSRYWKLTADEVEKLTHNPDKILNWEIKGIRKPEVEAKFIGVFMYRHGTPLNYESKKGIVYYYNNIDRKLQKSQNFFKIVMAVTKSKRAREFF